MPFKSLRKIKTEVVCPPKVGEIVEGTVLERGRSSLFLDLGAKGVGIIYGREFFQAKDSLKELSTGDNVRAKVIGLETDEGYRELSFSEANQEIAWQELENAKNRGEIFDLLIKGANKGGLTAQIKGINGFLPASQLLPEHYPKVQGADISKIAAELQKLVGIKLKARILDIDAGGKKLILSEKAVEQEKIGQELMEYNVGDTVEGEISGVTNFGAFMKFGRGLEGLIHSSEISDKNKSPAANLKIGKKAKAKIIEIKNDRIYLSLK